MSNHLLKSSPPNIKLQSKSKDHGTFHVIWFMVICSMSLSSHFVRLGYGWKIFVNTYLRFGILIPFSIYLIIAGCLIRQQAIQQLGKWFTVTIHLNNEQKLIESGWYGKMRHPSYTGVLMIFFGLGLIMNNWLGLIVIVIPVTLAFLYRIDMEEKELKAHFGSNYNEYVRKVPAKLIPFIF